MSIGPVCDDLSIFRPDGWFAGPVAQVIRGDGTVEFCEGDAIQVGDYWDGGDA